jgi:hypothetical protein
MGCAQGVELLQQALALLGRGPGSRQFDPQGVLRARLDGGSKANGGRKDRRQHRKEWNAQHGGAHSQAIS